MCEYDFIDTLVRRAPRVDIARADQGIPVEICDLLERVLSYYWYIHVKWEVVSSTHWREKKGNRFGFFPLITNSYNVPLGIRSGLQLVVIWLWIQWMQKESSDWRDARHVHGIYHNVFTALNFRHRDC